MIDYNELPMDVFESIAPYDLDGMILQDCTFLSHEAVLKAVEWWWKEHGDFIMEAVLEKVRASEGSP